MENLPEMLVKSWSAFGRYNVLYIFYISLDIILITTKFGFLQYIVFYSESNHLNWISFYKNEMLIKGI